MKKESFLEECKKIIFKNRELFQVLEEYDKTHRLKKISYKERANFTIDSTILRKFRDYCRKNNINMSAKIESLIIKELKTKL